MRNIRTIQAANRAQQGGFTLVELIVVIAIGFGIIFLAMTKIPQVLANSRASGEITELPGIAAEMQRIAANRPNWSTFTLDSMIRTPAISLASRRRRCRSASARLWSSVWRKCSAASTSTERTRALSAPARSLKRMAHR